MKVLLFCSMSFQLEQVRVDKDLEEIRKRIGMIEETLDDKKKNK